MRTVRAVLEVISISDNVKRLFLLDFSLKATWG